MQDLAGAALDRNQVTVDTEMPVLVTVIYNRRGGAGQRVHERVNCE